ncbi:MAG: ribosome maturation factor RimM [Rhodovarius sp.]|nr:ribosome maturation factor RimM [Rhodovarius sp.]
MPERLILIAELGRAHGVRGLLRFRCFGEHPIGHYNPLRDAAGRRFVLHQHGPDLVSIEGVADRTAAERLTGTKLYIERDRLPPPEDPEEFYLADLIGLAAVAVSGEALGQVVAVADHGAGAYLTLSGPPERLIPFTRACVPVVDIAGGRIVVDPPAETEARPE